MKRSLQLISGIGSIGVIAGVGWFVLSRPHTTTRHAVPPAKDLRLVEAQKSPKEFIAKNESSKDVKVQTLVTRARMTMAYDAANKKDYSTARAEFIEASYKHKGTDAMNPDFGTLSDQAAYQAIVCLENEGLNQGDGKGDRIGKKLDPKNLTRSQQEAQKEYRKFMAERPLSPLIHACARRLERLNGDALSPEDQLRLENGIATQEKQIAFETSVCGPKSLEKILPLLGKDGMSYKELAKVCRTDDKGTSLEHLKQGCESLGLKPIGLDLNAKDFNAMRRPFIWLQADHYVAILEIKDGKAHLYDPRFRADDWCPLPKNDDAKFHATVLAFETPNADLTIEPHKTKNTLLGGATK